MKMNLLVCGCFVLSFASIGSAAVVVDGDWTVNAAISQGSPVGMTAYQTFAGLSGGPITDVSVDLNISGGYNAGLYGYLVLQDAHGNTATEILLNQVGTSSSNPLGSSGAGFNVTLSDSGTANGSIHNAAGIPTGTWLPDSAGTLDGTFGGMTANGTWTLFLADMTVGGGTSTLNSWGLDISVADIAAVPESSRLGWLVGFGAVVAVTAEMILRRRREFVPGLE